jgi:hypothetical protein
LDHTPCFHASSDVPFRTWPISNQPTLFACHPFSPPLKYLQPTMTSPRVMMQNDSPEPFPSLSSPPSPKSPTAEHSNPNRSRQTSSTSTLQSRLRSASKSFQESSPPTGMCIATAQVASSVPSLSDIRRGSYNSDGWSGEGQIQEKKRRASLSTRRGSQTAEGRRSSVDPHSPRQPSEQFRHDSVPEAAEERDQHELASGPSAGITLEDMDSTSKPIEMETRMKKQTSTNQRSSSDTKTSLHASAANNDSQFLTRPFDNGYQFPPRHTWIESTAIFLTAFWKFFITPVGFLVTIYVCSPEFFLSLVVLHPLSKKHIIPCGFETSSGCVPCPSNSYTRTILN